MGRFGFKKGDDDDNDSSRSALFGSRSSKNKSPAPQSQNPYAQAAIPPDAYTKAKMNAGIVPPQNGGFNRVRILGGSRATTVVAFRRLVSRDPAPVILTQELHQTTMGVTISMDHHRVVKGAPVVVKGQVSLQRNSAIRTDTEVAVAETPTQATNRAVEHHDKVVMADLDPVITSKTAIETSCLAEHVRGFSSSNHHEIRRVVLLIISIRQRVRVRVVPEVIKVMEHMATGNSPPKKRRKRTLRRPSKKSGS